LSAAATAIDTKKKSHVTKVRKLLCLIFGGDFQLAGSGHGQAESRRCQRPPRTTAIDEEAKNPNARPQYAIGVSIVCWHNQPHGWVINYLGT
jgi:hypothetical protein